MQTRNSLIINADGYSQKRREELEILKSLAFKKLTKRFRLISYYEL